MIKTAIHKSLRILGLDLIRYRPPREVYPPDFAPEEIEIVREVRAWTMTSPERIFALIQAARYVSVNGIKGDIVECGVWKGGSMAAIARTLLRLEDTTRHLYLLNTFAGMPEPTVNDVEYSGKHASEVMREEVGRVATTHPSRWYKKSCMRPDIPRKEFISCMAEWSRPFRLQYRILSPRPDTDWYESTRHQIRLDLFPRLSKAGVIIVDDYGHWKGSAGL